MNTAIWNGFAWFGIVSLVAIILGACGLGLMWLLAEGMSDRS